MVLIIPSVNLEQSLPVIGIRVRETVQLSSAALAAAAFTAIVTIRAIRRLMIRDAVISHSRPLFTPDMTSIRGHDPEFRSDQFLKTAQSTFHQVQRARQTQRADSVRGLMSEDLWHAFSDAEAEDATSKRHMVIDHLKLHSAIVQSVVNIERWDAITVRMIASCAEYLVDEHGHTFGDRRIRAWREDWTFERSSDPNSHLRKTWCLTAVQPVVTDRFGSQRRRSMTEWNPTEQRTTPTA